MGLGLELIMKICVVSLFPEMVKKILNFGVIGRSEANGIMSLSVINPRDFTDDNYQKVDDKPYGGGPGMVMKYEPLKRSVEMAKKKFSGTAPVILLSPQGARFNQKTAKRFSQYSELIFVCGRYEGIDQRFIDSNVDEEISIGDFVLTGGEIGVMAIIDATVRLLPGALGDESSRTDESFEDGLLEYPHYTRPRQIDGLKCPDVLLSGDHEAIKKWRKEQSIIKTSQNRPDLLNNLTDSKSTDIQKKYIKKIKQTVKE